jgi:hypothetical protein
MLEGFVNPSPAASIPSKVDQIVIFILCHVAVQGSDQARLVVSTCDTSN